MLGERLKRARKARGLSLRGLGEVVDLSHAAIKKYEDGVSTPPSDVLIRLTRALHIRTEYLLRPDTVALDGIEYRKRSTLPKKRLNAIMHEVLDQIERRLELEELFPTSPVHAFETVSGLPTQLAQLDDVEAAAECVRNAWALGFDPIPDLVDVLETHGIRVFMVETDREQKFDGLAARVQGLPIVVVDRRWPGDRQRFTLAHELGHLMLAGRLAPAINDELSCNRFAGAFLFPRQSVLQELGERRNYIELKELSLLKDEFGLSMQGILYRARDLGIITPAWRDEQAKIFRIKGWHVKEPGTQYPVECAHVFEQLVFHALAEDYIGESKAAELMKIPLSSFKTLRALAGGDVAAHQ